jgi:hypothetical protein
MVNFSQSVEWGSHWDKKIFLNLYSRRNRWSERKKEAVVQKMKHIFIGQMGKNNPHLILNLWNPRKEFPFPFTWITAFLSKVSRACWWISNLHEIWTNPKLREEDSVGYHLEITTKMKKFFTTPKEITFKQRRSNKIFPAFIFVVSRKHLCKHETNTHKQINTENLTHTPTLT